MIDWKWIGAHEPPKGIHLVVWNCEYDHVDIARYTGDNLWISDDAEVGYILASEISHWALPEKPTVFE